LFLGVCFKIKSNLDRDKEQLVDSEQQQLDVENNDENDESQDKTKFVSNLRFVIGGLALPTIAVCIEKLVYGLIMGEPNYNASILRTSLVGYCFLLIFFCKVLSYFE